MRKRRDRYISPFTSVRERRVARNQRILAIFIRLSPIYESNDLIQWLADRFYVSPATVYEILFGDGKRQPTQLNGSIRRAPAQKVREASKNQLAMKFEES